MLEAAPAPGSVADPKVRRGSGFVLVLVPSAGVHQAKDRQSSLADQIGVHLHEISRKEQRLNDRSAPVWFSNSVRR